MRRIFRPPFAPLARPAAAFVLLEVILSLTIFAFAVVALMTSFTRSFEAVKRMEIQTQASFLAKQVLEEYEVFPLQADEFEAGFGEAYPHFYYRIAMEVENPRYRDVEREADSQIEHYFGMKNYRLEIHYDDGNEHYIALQLDTRVIDFEKFSPATIESYTTNPWL